MYLPWTAPAVTFEEVNQGDQLESIPLRADRSPTTLGSRALLGPASLQLVEGAQAQVASDPAS